MNRLENEFWIKILELKSLKIDINKVTKDDTKKILKTFDICLNNQDILAGACVLYRKNTLLRFAINLVFKYYLSSFKKYC